MIHAAIRCLAGELNEFFCRTLDTAEELVVVSNLLGADGAVAPDVSNKIVLFLTAIERDTVTQRAPDLAGRTFAGGGPLFLNIYLMAAANFTGRNYQDALRLISLLIGFLHHKPVFDRNNCPAMESSIERLIFDIENTPPPVMSNIWGVLGGRYLPSILYRVRVVAIDNANIIGRHIGIAEPAVAVAGRERS
jgi:hypothetical protein